MVFTTTIKTENQALEFYYNKEGQLSFNLKGSGRPCGKILHLHNRIQIGLPLVFNYFGFSDYGQEIDTHLFEGSTIEDIIIE